MMTVEEAITGRRSIRAFLSKPVPRALIEQILEIASRAPSGNNAQPWRVWVLEGEAKEQLARDLYERFMRDEPAHYDYFYYMRQWREPYLARRRKTGWGLYGLLGIAKGDRAASKAQHARNFLFFDAPVGLFFTIDRDLGLGAWLDYGMFLQSIMIAARSFGLETCPQAAFCQYHHIIEKRLGIPSDQILVCGMALGYADPEAKVNQFRTDREPVSSFTTFMDRLPD
jgi:nitroreductase|nr:MAG: hypothetical protein DIU57_00535 [Pseudomonadota bacterium]